MNWIEISSVAYGEIYNRYIDKFTVFGTFTNLENNSRFSARVLTEWGFKGAEEPLIKCVKEPQSQAEPEPYSLWEGKHYLNISDNQKANS